MTRQAKISCYGILFISMVSACQYKLPKESKDISIVNNVKANEKVDRKQLLANQNNPGNPANDFIYITPRNSKEWMYAIQASHLILFFYNPECHACKEYKDALVASSIIRQKINNGDLKVLAVYVDKDEATWRWHLPDMPRQWIHGSDDDEYLYKHDVYDLHAIPSIYLLDKDKKVLLKDCLDIQKLEKKLEDTTKTPSDNPMEITE